MLFRCWAFGPQLNLIIYSIWITTDWKHTLGVWPHLWICPHRAIWDHLGHLGPSGTFQPSVIIWEYLRPLGTIWDFFRPFRTISDHCFGTILYHFVSFWIIWILKENFLYPFSISIFLFSNIHYQLYISHFLLFIIHFSLFMMYFQLSIIQYP